MTFKRLAIFAACQFLFGKTWAQGTSTDTISNLSHTAVAKFYSSIVNEDQQLYNGPEYIWSYPKSTGHPFYIEDGFQEGTIQYDGVRYYGVPVQYELVKEVVVVKGANDARIELASEKVTEFSVGKGFFKRIAHPDLTSSFYQQLYDSKGIEILAQRKKVFKRSGKAEDLDVFREEDSYYVGKENRYYKIDDAADLYKLFGDKEKSLKNFAKSRKLAFRKDPQTFILEIVGYYNSI